MICNGCVRAVVLRPQCRSTLRRRSYAPAAARNFVQATPSVAAAAQRASKVPRLRAASVRVHAPSGAALRPSPGASLRLALEARQNELGDALRRHHRIVAELAWRGCSLRHRIVDHAARERFQLLVGSILVGICSLRRLIVCRTHAIGCKKGFVRRSTPIEVRGPCPGTTIAFSGKRSKRCWIERSSSSNEPPHKSVLPTLPAKSVSPLNTVGLASPSTRLMLPGECPGVCMTASAFLPNSIP